MKLKLPAGVSSEQDLRSAIAEVRDYARWFSHASIKKQVSKGGLGDPPGVSETAATIVRDWAGDKPLLKEDLDKLIESLQDFAKDAPSISITLAAPASGGLKKDLVTWCRHNVEPNVLVNFQFNSTILGGMVVRYRSHVYDWSFRRQIIESRAKFPEIIRNV